MELYGGDSFVDDRPATAAKAPAAKAAAQPSSSGAAGSSDWPPPPPVPSAAAATMGRRARASAGASRSAFSATEACLAVVRLRFGKISVYRKQNRFEAVCNQHDGKCVLTRSGKEHKGVGREGQGRPVGLMAAWLDMADCFDTAAEHMNPMVPVCVAREDRQAARERVKVLEGGVALLGQERPKDTSRGEESEPDFVP